MRKQLLLALPLSLGMFVSGCCTDGTCYTSSTEESTQYAATTVNPDADAEAATVAVKEEPVVSAPVMLASTAVTPAATSAYAPPAVAPREDSVEFSREAATTKIVQRIPSMNLPDGWEYIDEGELSGGRVNTVAVDETFGQTSSSAMASDS